MKYQYNNNAYFMGQAPGISFDRSQSDFGD